MQVGVQELRTAVLVLEDGDHPSSRRSLRIRRLLRAIHNYPELTPAIWSVPRATVLAHFERTRNKHERAKILAGVFPELAPQLPPKRHITMTEDERFSIFDAVANVVAAVERPPFE